MKLEKLTTVEINNQTVKKNFNLMERAYTGLSQSLDFLNKKVFDGEFKNIIFVIQSETSNNEEVKMLGSFQEDIWVNEEYKVSEISLISEYLQMKDPKNILLTLVHELIHFKAKIEGITETSRKGFYHNNKFKLLGEQYGLIFSEKNKKYGWIQTGYDEYLNSVFNECIALNKLDEVLLPLQRQIPIKKEKTASTKKTFKFKCPVCKTEVKAKYKTLLICGKDMANFEFADELPDKLPETENNG